MEEIFVLNPRNEKYSYYKLKDGYDYVRFILEKVDGIWVLVAFDYGEIGNTRHRTDGGNIMLYRKDCPGRESTYAKKRVEELYIIAREKMDVFVTKNVNCEIISCLETYIIKN